MPDFVGVENYIEPYMWLMASRKKRSINFLGTSPGLSSRIS